MRIAKIDDRFDGRLTICGMLLFGFMRLVRRKGEWYGLVTVLYASQLQRNEDCDHLEDVKDLPDHHACVWRLNTPAP